MSHILIVEDEEAIGRGLQDCLESQGHRVTWLADGDAGLKEAVEGCADMLLLDVMLPGTDGFSICRAAREAHPERAIMMLTAKGGEEDILTGFSAGADDYVSKPFSVVQLLARIDALVRRCPPQHTEQKTQCGRLCVDYDALQISYAERVVDINRRDADLLVLFYQERGRILSRRRLLRDIWDYACPDMVETRSVDMHLTKLRRKIKTVLGKDEKQFCIETIRGEGYRCMCEGLL